MIEPLQCDSTDGQCSELCGADHAFMAFLSLCSLSGVY